MSDQQSAIIGAGGGKWITDPRQLPLTVLPEAQLYVKTSNSTSDFASDANAANFFTAIARRGAQASVSVADTYVTVANLSGRGRLYSVIAPSVASVYTPTVRLTIDGTVYTITPGTTISASYRMVLGAFTPGLPNVVSTATYNTADFSLPSSYNDIGFNGAMVGTSAFPNSGNITIPPPEIMEAYNLSFLQFDSSCLIEVKTSLLAAGTGDKRGGAVYRMLP